MKFDFKKFRIFLVMINQLTKIYTVSCCKIKCVIIDNSNYIIEFLQNKITTDLKSYIFYCKKIEIIIFWFL